MSSVRFTLTLMLAVAMLVALAYRAIDRPILRETIQATPITYRIHINTADEATLSLLPGVGPGIARHIVDHRDTHGPFAEPADLEAVHMIGPQKRQAIAPWVVFD